MKADRALVDELDHIVVGRRRELEIIVAALAAQRHVLLEGPPGTGKSTLLRAVAGVAGAGFVFVEGNAELTPSRLIGHFDPARVLTDGYDPDVFVDGPLVRALRDGALLYVEEINRVPEETLNVLVSVMSEAELHVPRLGQVDAAPGFALVAAMNPFDAIGTARISSAIYDRMCRVTMGYQDAPTEARIVAREAPDADPGFTQRVVSVVRASREHPDVRIGSSVRGAIDLVRLADELAHLRDLAPDAPGVGLDAALAALSGRLRVAESTDRRADDIVRELWLAEFGRDEQPGGAEDKTDAGRRDDQADPGRAGRAPPPGKSLTPPAGGGAGSDQVQEGQEARDALDDEPRESTSRAALGRHPGFQEISPQVGQLDQDAFDRALSEDPDQALVLLGELTGATDEGLRRLARRLAARVMIDVARQGPARRRGSGRRATAPADRAEGDLDLDASLDALVVARAAGHAPMLDDLRVGIWTRPDTAICFVVDRSGSMSGARLATAAVGAAACAWRAGTDHSVVAFGVNALVLKTQDEARSPEAVTDDVLRLRGFGPTDLALALDVARMQLDRSQARRRVVVLLSDARPTAGPDPTPLAAALDELCILAPADDHEDAAALARAVGARWAPVVGPSGVPAALRELLDP